ncbi:response regulator transcription factor [Ralstonia sp. RL]|uniref:response regulator n=1 Tax=Ralstonia sp. RL TaxID=1839756 RepID=UPI000AB23EC5|nr:response regulator transcription factor [Ralstonia sp. RL]
MATTTVAIIEDNPEFLTRFCEIIQSDTEFELTGFAANGSEGFALIDSNRADVYLVDLGLPDMSGIEVIKHALKTHPDCDVMVITVFGDDSHVIASIEAGATGYILKDSSPTEIADCIRELRNGGSPISPVIARKILQRFQQNKSEAVKKMEALPSEDASSDASTELTDREVQILRVLAKGLSFKEIGELHFISAHTVARHVKKIYHKLAVHSRGEAVYEATKMGIIQL